MPISPEDAEDLAQAIVQAHTDTERSIFSKMADFIRPAIDSNAGPNKGLVSRFVGGLVGTLRGRTRGAVAKASDEAAKRGTEAANEDLGDRAKNLPPGRTRATGKEVDRTVKHLTSAQDQMVKQTVNQYSKIIGQVAQLVDQGKETRLKAAQLALNKFASAGITGFVDVRGRNWELASYTEMAVRTETAKIMVDAHIDRLQEAGINLVIVSNAPYECPLCKPWEGKILTTNGSDGKHTVTVKGTTVEVAGSLSEARKAGLFHPNCRHNVSAYQPGYTRPAPKPDTKGVTHKDMEKQRYLERQARMWDRRRSVAMDDKAKTLAEAKFAAYRKAIRDHVTATGLPRKSHRELNDKAR